LIIATGSRPNRFGWPGQDLDAVQGLYGIPDLLEMDKWTRDVDRAVVVGGGLTGVEMVEMLHSRGIPVTFLVRESAYMDYLLPAEEAAMVAAEIREHGIDLRLGTELSAIHGSKGGRARSVTTSTGETIPCEFVGLTVGVSPNVAFLEDSGVEIGRGVLVDRHFETSVPGVYAIGDCAEFRQSGVGHSSVEQLWYAARRHGRTVARSVCGDRTAYDRGVHFNSAKFFDLEYQTYGTVAPAMMEGEDTLVWVPDTGRRLVRINFEQASGRVKGFNLLGVRFRHRICEEWLRQGASVSEVVAHLSEARFDPEFSFDAVSAARTRFRDRLASVSD